MCERTLWYRQRLRSRSSCPAATGLWRRWGRTCWVCRCAACHGRVASHPGRIHRKPHHWHTCRQEDNYFSSLYLYSCLIVVLYEQSWCHTHSLVRPEAVHLPIFPVTLILIVLVESFKGSDKFPKPAQARSVKRPLVKITNSDIKAHKQWASMMRDYTHPSSSPFLNSPVYIRPSGHFKTPLKQINKLG